MLHVVIVLSADDVDCWVTPDSRFAGRLLKSLDIVETPFAEPGYAMERAHQWSEILAQHGVTSEFQIGEGWDPNWSW